MGLTRALVAIAAARTIGALSRLSGRGGGTTFPGDVARAIDPGILRRLTSQFRCGSILVTGTNGKTTTARLIAELLSVPPVVVLANRAGSNLIFGATAAVVRAARLDGSIRADWGVFEVDEASLQTAVAEIRPRVVVVGNLFRDQLDRYGELERLAKTIEVALSNLPPGARTVMNADDPRVAEIGMSLDPPPIWYGLGDAAVGSAVLPHAADARSCPRCGSTLLFSTVYVGHDGEWRCPRGDFTRPSPQVLATGIERTGFQKIALDAVGHRFEVGLGGLYNAYNLTAAIATATALELDPGQLAERLAKVGPAFGRQERFERQGRRFTLLLAKNPTGFNEILREAVLAGAEYFLIALNDGLADGTDVSWIWDVDFEQLEGAELVVPTGSRAADLALRLKYAEVAADPAQVDLEGALDRIVAGTPPGREAHLLLTYTALLQLRQLLVKRGWLQPFWSI